MSADATTKSQKRGIYLLPNLFTTAGLFAGFYSIVASMQGKVVLACIAIFVAMIADSLDGRVARLTNTASDFGAQYDSLSDMIAFGLAPALLLYTWTLHHLGKVGWLCAFFYVASAGLRLARFNIQLDIVDKRFFKGLSSPPAAGFLTALVWLLVQNGIEMDKGIAWMFAGLAVWMAILMVSNIDYYSFKVFEFKGLVPFTALIVVVLLIVAIAMDPAQVLFYLFAAYVILGPVLAWRSKKKLSNGSRGQAS